MITVIYCTKEHNPTHTEHIKQLSGAKDIQVIEYVNNGEGLTAPYNKCLAQAEYDIVVFMHDDVEILTKNFAKKLIKHFDRNPEFGIIGAAGGKNIPVSGKWWEDKKKMYGRVYHTHQGNTWLSEYSPDSGNRIVETAMVDGLFFAIHKDRIKQKFDESVKGFHFYEITFCMQNILDGVKIGVFTDIKLNHMSIGQTNDEWERNRVMFAERFKDNLPINIPKDFTHTKVNVLVFWLSTSQDGKEIKDVVRIIKLLENNNCNVTLLTDVNTSVINKSFRGVKAFNISEPEGFKKGDGIWSLNSPQGPILSKPNVLYPIKEVNYDVINILCNPESASILHQPIEWIKQFYSTIPMITCNVNTEDLNETITEYINTINA